MQKELIIDNSKVTNDYENIHLKSILLLVKNVYTYFSMMFIRKVLPALRSANSPNSCEFEVLPERRSANSPNSCEFEVLPALHSANSPNSCEFEVLPILMRYMKYVPLVVEIYLIIFNILIAKLWFMMNILCTVLFIYVNLNENDKKIVPINKYHINIFAIVCIATGIMMILFCVQKISIISLAMIIYLISRMTKNIFGLGL